ncbi:RNA polymerase sigma factor [Peterkaempfera griseoplana]|uniref:RNA polymerase sigma factor n=1 Tax=Peterkaempfera griseoplana TaxID=66896 RepID=UPI00099EF4A0|nr:sigma-70 family RNA polymerase sigma factor [Peterkaempfera griseoplana]
MTAPADPRDPTRAAAQAADVQAAVEASIGEPERFALVYDVHYRAVHRYVAARLGPDAAEDVAAEVFLTAFRDRGRFDPRRGQVRPWLFGIATNLVGRHGRTERRRLARLRAGVEAESGFEDTVADKVAAQRLRPQLGTALGSLGRGDRDVLLLVAVAGLGYAEVADALGIPAGTVGSRMNRARAKVRRLLEATDAHPAPTTRKHTEDPHG